MHPGGPVIQVAGYGEWIEIQHIGYPHQPGIKILTHDPHGTLHRSIGCGVIADRPQAQFHLSDLRLRTTHGLECREIQFSKPFAAEFGKMRLAQTGEEQDIPAKVMAEQNALPVIDGIELSMPATQLTVFVQRGCGDHWQLGSQLFSAVDKHRERVATLSGHLCQ